MDDERRFSLLDNAWIPVLLDDGSIVDLSLRGIVDRADHVVKLLGESPTQAFAILRLLLAIVHRAIDGPAFDDWSQLHAADALPAARISTYLDNHADRFWLIHPSTPFYQVADLHSAKNEVSGLEKLIADVPAGGPLFVGRSGSALHRLSFAEAARWLVQLQAYDVSGIKTGAVGDPRVKGGKGYPIGTGHAGSLGGVHLAGDNLTRTVLLNLVADRPVGSAVWERPPHTAAPEGDAEGLRTPTGVTDLYTWQSRRVRLVSDGDQVTGVVVCNGDKLPVHDTFPLEPMTMWRRSRNQEKKLGRPLVYLPRLLDPAKSLWRSSEALLPQPPPGRAGDVPDDRPPGVVQHLVDQAEAEAENVPEARTVTLHAIGMRYGTQNAVTVEVMEDELSFHTALLHSRYPRLRHLVRDAVEAGVAACKAVGLFAADLVRAAGGYDDRQVAHRDRARETGYDLIDRKFRDWLSTLTGDTDIETAASQWQRTIRDSLHGLTRRLVAAAPLTAYQGRTYSDDQAKGDKKERTINVAIAQRMLRNRLRTALPLAFDTDSAKDHITS